MSKEFGGLLPLIALELPYLAGSEDSNDTGPVLRFKLLGGVDNNEADWSCGIDRGKDT